MAIIDIVQVHEDNKSDGSSFVETDGTNRVVKEKRFNTRSGARQADLTIATLTRRAIEDEITRLQAQVTTLQTFLSEQFPA